jgi:hypothetical protein
MDDLTDDLAAGLERLHVSTLEGLLRDKVAGRRAEHLVALKAKDYSSDCYWCALLRRWAESR